MPRTFMALCLAVLFLSMALPALGGLVHYEYDSLDRLIRVDYEDGRTLHFNYDAAGNVIWVGPVPDDGFTDASQPTDIRFLRLVSSYPNPFTDRTTVLFEIRAAQEVQAKVYDIRGRLVGNIPARTMGPGMQVLSWNGTDARGAGVASGVYFVKIQTEHTTASLRVLLVR